MSRVLRIVLVEDQDLVREMISIGAEREGSIVVGETAHGERAVELIGSLRPDVALIDLNLPGLDGLGVISSLRRLGVDSKLMVVSVSCDADTVTKAMAAGADGFVDKDVSSAELFDAMHRVAAGERVISPRAQATLARVDPPEEA